MNLLNLFYATKNMREANDYLQLPFGPFLINPMRLLVNCFKDIVFKDVIFYESHTIKLPLIVMTGPKNLAIVNGLT